MKFDIITIFPKMFDSYFNESILGRAKKEKLIDIETHNLQEYTTDKHQTVDDTPCGGGAGMVMKVEPIFNCVEKIKDYIQKTGSRVVRNSIPSVATDGRIFNSPPRRIMNRDDNTNKKSRIILFSAKGKKYTQRDAERLAEYDNLILICGRYEGVDERVAEHIADEELSIGDYVLTGGEVPAMVVVDSVSRLISGVLGNKKSLEEESFSKSRKLQAKKIKTKLEYPQYTKPEEFNNWKVPSILLSGDHQKIKKWRNEKQK